MGLSFNLERHAKFLPLIPALILIFFGYYLDQGTGGSDVQPAPALGQEAILHVENQGDSLQFGDRFSLEVSQRTDMALNLGEEPEPLPCRFAVEISGKNTVGRRFVFRELDYAGEYVAGKTIFFRSQLFDVPAGENVAKIENLGCTDSIDFQEATVSITPVGEHLLAPILAMLLRWMGYILIAGSAVAALLIFARSKNKSPKNQSQN